MSSRFYRRLRAGWGSVLVVLAWALVAPAAAAQAPPDSAAGLPAYALPDVTVTATRTAVPTRAASMRVTVLRAEMLDRTGAQTLADALSDHGGAFIRRYGNGLATMTLRGAGSAQTLVLLDGLRIADPQLGQLDLSLLPTLLLSSVEVMHGAGSALYGTDGVGGVVNLRTLPPGDAFRAMAGYGAYGAHTGGLLLGTTQGRWAATALAEAATADGDFPYLNTARFPAREERRANADRLRRSLYGTATYRGDRHQLRLAAWHHDAERGLPGLATTPHHGERQWDAHLRLWGEETLRLPNGTLRVHALVQRAALRYVNPQLDLDATGRTLLASGEATAGLVLGPRWLLDVGLGGGTGTATHPSLAGRATERRAEAFVHGTGSFGRLLVYPALRADAYFGGGRRQGALSPRLGLNLRLHDAPAWHLKASAGRAFRRPTFNDRYWQPGGNPDLRPEHGWTYDAGLFAEGARHQAEVSLFAAVTRDQIIWQPTTAGFYAPANVSRTRTLGAEVSWRGQGRLGARPVAAEVAYTFTDARDRSAPGTPAYDQPLRYVPREQLKASVDATLGLVGLGLIGRYVGRRYVTTDGSQYLDPYLVLDAHARVARRFGGLRAQLSLAVENVLDTPYAVVQHYPMPPRHARLRLLVEAAHR